jgi:hypothetical protein
MIFNKSTWMECAVTQSSMMPKPKCPLSSALQQQTQQPNQITCVNQSTNQTATPRQQPTYYRGLDLELGQWTSVISINVVDDQFPAIGSRQR